MNPSVRISWLSLVMATITAACGSVSESTYQAESLTVFLPAKQDQVLDAGIDLLAGWLTSESEVVRVLGPRSSWLRAYAAILQVRIRAGSSAVKVSRDSFKLRLSTGEELRSLSSEEVLAVVSLPDDFHLGRGWGWSPEKNEQNPATVLLLLGEVALSLEVDTETTNRREKASAARYRESARADAEKKTMLPREIRPGESLDLLVVAVPKTGKPLAVDALTLTAEFTVDGENWKKDLVVGLK